MSLKHDTATNTSSTPQIPPEASPDTGEPCATRDRTRIEPFLTKCQELWPGAQIPPPYMPSALVRSHARLHLATAEIRVSANPRRPMPATSATERNDPCRA